MPTRGLACDNRAANGRAAPWSEGEAARMFKAAWRGGYHGLAAVIAVAWSTQLSRAMCAPCAQANCVRAHPARFSLSSEQKTSKPVGGALIDRAWAALEAYVAKLGIKPHPEAYLFRNRSGAPYSKGTLGDDFRDVRAVAFPGDMRQLADFRRSGANEAIAGDATAEQLSHAMGNTLRQFETYAPVNLASIKAVTRARQLGRRRLRENG